MKIKNITLLLVSCMLGWLFVEYILYWRNDGLESRETFTPQSSLKGFDHVHDKQHEGVGLGLADTLPRQDSQDTLEEKDVHLEGGSVQKEDGKSGKEEGEGSLVKMIETPREVASAPLLRIVVLSYKRAESLKRLLRSLNEAVYDGLPAVVDIHVDRGKDSTVHNDTVTVARNFSFKHGASHVTVRPQHGGVVGQWLGSWKVPQDDNSELAVFLEDDLTVSPFFARWLRRVHAKYDSYTAIAGYSLQAETMRHASGTDSSLMEGPEGQQIFAYPVLGSWGFSPNTPRWREFLRWYGEASKDEKFVPLVPGLKTTGWYRQLRNMNRKDTMWTQWHIYHTNKLQQFTLYPHFADKQGLSFNWKEAGEHYSSAAAGKGLKEAVLTSWPSPDLFLPDTLTVMDAKGQVSKQKLTATGLQ